MTAAGLADGASVHVQASAEDLQQQEASLAFIRSLSQQSGFVSSTTEWRRRQGYLFG